MAVGVCLLVVLQPVSGVVSEKWVVFSAALQLVSRSRSVHGQYQRGGTWG